MAPDRVRPTRLRVLPLRRYRTDLLQTHRVKTAARGLHPHRGEMKHAPRRQRRLPPRRTRLVGARRRRNNARRCEQLSHRRSRKLLNLPPTPRQYVLPQIYCVNASPVAGLRPRGALPNRTLQPEIRLTIRSPTLTVRNRRISRIHNRNRVIHRAPQFQAIIAFMKTVLTLHERAKSLPKSFSGSCATKTRANSGLLVCLAAITLMLLPVGASAQVANFVFVTDPQAIVPGAVSEQMTVQAQSSGGTSANIPQTACFSFNTSSSQGQFSSSATTWNPVTVLTMNKNTANKSFYYKDTQEGTHTLTVKISLKPEDESRSCANWPVGEWDISWTATQNITVGTGSSSSNSETSAATSTNQSVSTGNSSVDSIMPPPPKLFADGGSDRTVVVGADTEFRARAYDEKKNIIDFSRFHWNFGDGTTADTAVAMHRFEYPGRYVVVLDMPEQKDAVADQFIVTVERVELALSLMEDGGVMIENRAGRTLDRAQDALPKGRLQAGQGVAQLSFVGDLRRRGAAAWPARWGGTSARRSRG